jgi:hypothetical protein
MQLGKNFHFKEREGHVQSKRAGFNEVLSKEWIKLFRVYRLRALDLHVR